MPTSAIDSLIFRNMFGDSAIRQIWSDEYRTQRYLDWEAALARAQAGLGLIPRFPPLAVPRAGLEPNRRGMQNFNQCARLPPTPSILFGSNFRPVPWRPVRCRDFCH
jgi:hypothetical protein